jgi:exonuclease III
MWNIQGIRNKTGEIINGWEELNQDTMILTETKEKGNGVETLGYYIHFYSRVSKEKGAK